MPRIAGIDIPPNKPIGISLTYLYGVGRANAKVILKEAKMGPENVVKTTVFLRDMNDFPKMNEAYGTYFGKEPPARSTIQAAALPRGVAVEIDVIAAF